MNNHLIFKLSAFLLMVAVVTDKTLAVERYRVRRFPHVPPFQYKGPSLVQGAAPRVGSLLGGDRNTPPPQLETAYIRPVSHNAVPNTVFRGYPPLSNRPVLPNRPSGDAPHRSGHGYIAGQGFHHGTLKTAPPPIETGNTAYKIRRYNGVQIKPISLYPIPTTTTTTKAPAIENEDENQTKSILPYLSSIQGLLGTKSTLETIKGIAKIAANKDGLRFIANFIKSGVISNPQTSVQLEPFEKVETNKPSTSNGALHHVYGPPTPQDPYDGPKQIYGTPVQTYGPPAQKYGLPTQTYGKPNQTYQPPAHTYGPPTQTYGPPTLSPPASTSSYPAQTYGKPNQTYQPPAQTYGPPTQTYGPPTLSPPASTSSYPAPTYGPPVQISSTGTSETPNPHAQTYVPPVQTYGPPAEEYGVPLPKPDSPAQYNTKVQENSASAKKVVTPDQKFNSVGSSTQQPFVIYEVPSIPFSASSPLETDNVSNIPSYDSPITSYGVPISTAPVNEISSSSVEAISVTTNGSNLAVSALPEFPRLPISLEVPKQLNPKNAFEDSQPIQEHKEITETTPIYYDLPKKDFVNFSTNSVSQIASDTEKFEIIVVEEPTQNSGVVKTTYEAPGYSFTQYKNTDIDNEASSSNIEEAVTTLEAVQSDISDEWEDPKTVLTAIPLIIEREPTLSSNTNNIMTINRSRKTWQS